MIPNPSPLAIDVVSGISTSVRNAGKAISGCFHSISPSVCSIRLPTTISAGAVAAVGTMLTNGATTSERETAGRSQWR